MATSNAINANTTGLARYNGTGTWDAVTVTNHAILLGAASNGITSLGLGNAGQVLQSGGAGADAAFSTATYPSTATGTGTILRANGTNWVATTATYPTTTTVNRILYSSSSNVIGEITTANNGTLITSSGGVPSISSTLPSAVQTNITSLGTVTTGNLNNSSYPMSNFLGATTFTPDVGGTPTYSTQLGRYHRVGDLLFIRIRLTFTGGPTGGGIAITGLPVAAPNNALLAAFSVFRATGTLTASSTQLMATMKQGVAQIDLYNYNPVTGTTVLAPQSASDDIIITGYYSAI